MDHTPLNKLVYLPSPELTLSTFDLGPCLLKIIERVGRVFLDFMTFSGGVARFFVSNGGVYTPLLQTLILLGL